LQKRPVILRRLLIVATPYHSWLFMTHMISTHDQVVAHKWDMAHMWMRHGTLANAPWHTNEWVMAHLWMSHGTQVNETWHTHDQVVAHKCTSHGTHTNGHGTHMSASTPWTHASTAWTHCTRRKRPVRHMSLQNMYVSAERDLCLVCIHTKRQVSWKCMYPPVTYETQVSFCGYIGVNRRGGGLGSRPIFKKFHETYAPS